MKRYLSDGVVEIKNSVINFKGHNSAYLRNYFVPLFLGVFIFFNIFPHTTTLKEACFYLALLGAFFTMARKEKDFIFRTPLAIPLSFFVVWSFATVVFAVDKVASLHDFYAHLVKYIFLYFLLVNYFDSKRRFLCLAKLILISVTIFSIGSLAYFYVWQGYDILSKFGTGFTDSAINVMGFATVFAMLIAGRFLLDNEEKVPRFLLWCAFIFNALASVLTQSRGTIIALLLSCLILFLKNKKIFIGIIVAVLLFLALTPVKSRFSAEGIVTDLRTSLAAYSFEVMKDYPILGTGFAVDTAFERSGDFNVEKYLERLSPEIRRKLKVFDLLLPHNMLLNYGVRVGSFGLLLFVTVFAVFVKICLSLILGGRDDFTKDWGRCLLAGFAVVFLKGLFEPITTHFVEVIYFTIFAMGTILLRINDEEPGLTADQGC